MNTTPSLNPRVSPRTARTVATLSALVLIGSLAALLISPDLVEGVRMVIRLTARTSLVFFLLAFIASALTRLWPMPETAWLLRHRRAFGLAFAVSHAVHLAAIIAFAKLDVPGFAHQSSFANFVTGGIAYVFIALMAATSWDGAVRWLGLQRWRLLHAVGAYYIWVSFVVTFSKRIPMSAGYVVPVVVLFAALLLRVSSKAWTRRHGKQLVVQQ
jgi:sulfoxide reductase heme-binding subunit YedZ